MKKLIWLSGALIIGCTSPADDGSAYAVEDSPQPAAVLADDDDGEEEDEVSIPLDQVPEAVKAAALAAMPGIVLEEAEVETEDGVVVYDLEGELDGVEYEIEVTEDGEVLEIERDEDEDGDGDGDGDGDDD